ncbi:MAG: hypothetical protein JXR37_17255 [Kiritimatiellae bacterium]|nr:hypothetical protein [Kiritimatiellia bacterium]
MPYEKFDLDQSAELALNYLTKMVDKDEDYLPYWLVRITSNPAWIKHCRVDDAELVASWYNAIVGVQEILGTSRGANVREAFKRHLYKHWGEHGLRFHADYPWSNTIHHAFHEDAYILAALNLIIERDGERKAKKLAADLVRGLRGLVYERKIRTFWSGDYPINQPVYEFPNDVFIKGKGFDFTRVTGRGEESIRNGMMLHAVVKHWQITGDAVSLDLATGLANHLLGMSRYFNHKGEFFGHVHSAVWVASGLALLGRLTQNERYVGFAEKIHDYVASLSSSFGWVPEYAQWHPMSEEHCETCCIKDMIECGFELIDAGHEAIYDLINRFVRNQLYEQQLKTGEFIAVDNTRKPGEPGLTYEDVDKRVVGGWSGGGEPNSISLARFRSVAGCCVGTAPQALHRVWQRTVENRKGTVYVNFPIERKAREATVRIGYPNEGWLKVTAGTARRLRIRTFPFMGERLSLAVNGKDRPLLWEGACLKVDGLKKGDAILLQHPLREDVRRETVRGVNYEVTWKGCDVVGLSPRGNPLVLYQRVLGQRKEIPPRPAAGGDTKLNAAPTEQKR